MKVERCGRTEFEQILEEVEDFWGSRRTLALHHPMLLHEFGDTAFVIKDGSRVVAYLFGFYSQTEPSGYVHLVAVRASHRQRGLARRLYRHFESAARRRGCAGLKAITTPGNAASMAFHAALGWEAEPHVDYAGRGEARVLLRKPL